MKREDDARKLRNVDLEIANLESDIRKKQRAQEELQIEIQRERTLLERKRIEMDEKEKEMKNMDWEIQQMQEELTSLKKRKNEATFGKK